MGFSDFWNMPEPANPTGDPVSAVQSAVHHTVNEMKSNKPWWVAALGFADGGPVPGFTKRGRVAPRVPDATASAAARHALRTGTRPGIAMPATRHRHETSPGVPCPSCAAGLTIPIR
ncbi:hypothetical protein ACLQ3K_16115 [Tsukamurella sp. DT100]|uniref:hypothetical protein n=1 Tax=Tsukamurella sp. DT100 TaxID=3393415 RepID=UPI003CF9461B